MWIIYLFYASLVLPAFSFSQLAIGIYFQNRILCIPFIFIWYIKHFSLAVSKCNVPILCLMFIFGTYSLFAVILGWNVMMYLGYFLTAFCLFLSLPIVNGNRLLFLRFFKLFFLLNCLFVVWQICCINLGLTSLSMLQSNL